MRRSRHLHRRIALSLCVPVAALTVMSSGAAWAAKPPPPGGGPVLTPGQLPHECTAADAGASGYSPMTGYYYSRASNTWVSAPSCYPKWGNLSASPPQVVAAGRPVTITAIPDTNSSQYAPETKSITWTYGGKRVAGCGPSDLTCTVVPAAKATTEWQWVQFQVTMPRIFFVDSQGSLCAGQHLCAGNSTNAWSFAGVPPIDRLCIGTCGQLAVELPPEVGGNGSLAPVDLTCGAGATCDVNAQTLLDPTKLTVHQQIMNDSLKKQGERWQIMKDMQTKLFDITQKETVQGKNAESYRKSNSEMNGYIYGSTNSTDVVALQATDAELSPLFPGSGPSLNIVTNKQAASLAMPPVDLVLLALGAATPSKAQLQALQQTLVLANSPDYSTDRAVARMNVSNGLLLGLRLLAVQGTAAHGKPIVIGSTSTTIPGGRSKSVSVRPSALGERTLRLVNLARGNTPVAVTASIDLRRSGSQHHATRKIPLG
jgi:hypothetical protein